MEKHRRPYEYTTQEFNESFMNILQHMKNRATVGSNISPRYLSKRFTKIYLKINIVVLAL